MIRTMLSPGAQRLLDLLTPEPITLGYREAMQPAVTELQRLGLITVQWGSEICFIALTRTAWGNAASISRVVN